VGEGAVGPGPDETLDELRRGRVRVLQPRRGYRLSIDALLLADFALRVTDGRIGRFCDLGAGVGVIGLCLALGDPQATGTLVELQPRLAELARRNVTLNGLEGRLEVRTADLRRLGRLPPQSWHLVVANPPFRPVGTTRPNADHEKAVANVELECRLEDVVRAAARLLGERGRLALVHEAGRLPDLLGALGAGALCAVDLRLVHPRQGEPAHRVLVLARRRGRRAPPLRVLGPLVLHELDGRWTPEAARILGEEGA
jgi:tRNA1Val (adenine37-N6)-methyltransferase